MLKIITLLVSLNTCGGVINHLSEKEYARIPPVFHLDPYEECIQEGGEYCSLRMQLVSDQPNNLLKTIEQYSEHKAHFNHTVLNHGICINKSCKNISQANITRDPRETLEGCLNRTLWKDYRLHAKLTEEPWCYKADAKKERIGVLDVIISVLLGVVLVLNVVGSLREFVITEKDTSILRSFSLKRNWQSLTGPSRLTGPRREGMRAFNGIRTINSIFVICAHSLMPFVISSANPRDWEEGYKYVKYVVTGSMVIQTFFAMSGFLLAYNMASFEGESRESCLKVFNRILLRWLRLVPPYLVMLALMMTWLRFVGSGPLWQTAVGDHLESCRRYWWLVPLNLNNYADHTQCFVEYWYIAAEMQLSILGLLVLGFLRGRVRWWTLGLLLVAGLVAPAAHTWVQDLDGWMLLAPEISRNFFVEDPTFNNVYKRGHTNLPAYVIGVASGLLVCGWHKANADKKHHDMLHHCRVIFWAAVPLMLAVIVSGSVFLAAPAPRALRAGYSALGRLLFGGGAAVVLAGLTLKIEELYRGFLSWPAWTTPARLSYCAYVVHVTLLRLYTGALTSLTYVSFPNTLCLFLGSVLAAFFVAIPLWLLIEAPTDKIIKSLMQTNTNDKLTVNGCEDKHAVNSTDNHIVVKL